MTSTHKEDLDQLNAQRALEGNELCGNDHLDEALELLEQYEEKK